MEQQKEMQQRFMEVRILESQIKQLEEQLAMIDNQTAEMNMLQSNINEIKGKKQNDIIAPLGRDVFVKSRLESSDNLLVNVGAGVILEMNPENAKNAVEKQKVGLLDARKAIVSEIERIIQRLALIEQEINAMQSRQ